MKPKAAIKQQGLYACTVINGQEHYFSSTKSNTEIPDPSSPQWKQGGCQTNFKVPKYANLLLVTMIGGGGAGKDASVIWEKEKDISDGLLIADGDSYNVEYDGWYHVKMYGQKGEQTHRTPWRNGDCDSVKDRRTVAHSNCRTYNMERGSRPYRTNCSRTLRG